MDLGIYFITSRDFGSTHEEVAELALKEGVKTIQFRDKNMNSGEMLDTAQRLRNLCDDYNASLMINDRVDIALASGADGVHVGQDDMPPQEVRRIFKGIVGVSVNNVKEAVEGEKYADYLGAGPVFPTATKKDARDVIGIEGLKRIVEAVSIPVIGIGSIKIENAPEVLRTGVAGIAVISAIAASSDPAGDAAKLLDAVKTSKNQK
ncbi:MAG: thiamine phosphate synthase [Archaeoglobaceae archaeon]